MLIHDGRVIVYVSRQLKVHEKNYHMHELELVANVHAPKLWRHYLYGVPCEHPGKANIVAYALSRKAESMDSLAYLLAVERPLAMDVQALANRFVRLDVSKPRNTVKRGGDKDIVIGDDGVLRLQSRICVPNVDGLRELILEEAHSLHYSIHPCVMKMYCNLKQHYWWRRMKKDIVAYISRCLNYQQVKYEHQYPCGLTHRLEIPE
ncbi:uncharacterized protein [Nicotiana tomentosiformis]|uniref:uncharacterized protein n=1 Tax=Nicotiana tomentosiformis TaxID=4098 RepID=UPI00388CC097